MSPKRAHVTLPASVSAPVQFTEMERERRVVGAVIVGATDREAPRGAGDDASVAADGVDAPRVGEAREQGLAGRCEDVVLAAELAHEK